MSEKKNNDNNHYPKEDRRKNSGGIRAGGRRKSDKAKIAPLGRSSKIWFWLSIGLSILIMIWTFTIPFGDKPILQWQDSKKAPEPLLVDEELRNHPEHLMDSDQYVAYAMEIEDNLREQLVEKYAVPENLPDEKHAKKMLEKVAAADQAAHLELKKQEAKLKDGFGKGSVRALELERLEADLQEKAH